MNLFLGSLPARARSWLEKAASPTGPQHVTRRRPMREAGAQAKTASAHWVHVVSDAWGPPASAATWGAPNPRGARSKEARGVGAVVLGVTFWLLDASQPSDGAIARRHHHHHHATLRRPPNRAGLRVLSRLLPPRAAEIPRHGLRLRSRRCRCGGCSPVAARLLRCVLLSPALANLDRLERMIVRARAPGGLGDLLGIRCVPIHCCEYGHAWWIGRIGERKFLWFVIGCDLGDSVHNILCVTEYASLGTKIVEITFVHFFFPYSSHGSFSTILLSYPSLGYVFWRNVAICDLVCSTRMMESVQCFMCSFLSHVWMLN